MFQVAEFVTGGNVIAFPQTGRYLRGVPVDFPIDKKLQMYRTALTFGCLIVATAALQAQEKKEEAPKINFTDHVQPIFREHCFKCHNANDAKGGLALDSYAALMEGGGSGEVVYDGDAEGSRLYQLMIHDDTPVMPPNQDPIAKEKLAVIHQWINGGLLENSGSKVRKKKGPTLSFATTTVGGKPDVIAMPESMWRVPIVASSRAAAASAVATSPWAPLVAVGGQKQVSLYNTDSAELVGILPYPEGVPQTVRFNVDGAYLLVAGGTHAAKGTAAIYDVKTGDRLLTVGDELDTVFGADISEDMKRIALGGPQKIVRVFDTSTGQMQFEMKKHTDWVYCVDYSPDGVLIASGDRSGGLHVWEADTGRLYLDLIGHKAAVRGIAWRSDSNVLVSASEDGTVKMWEMSAGRQLKSFNAHGGGATGVMMAKDGRIVTCGKDRTVKLWKADGGAIATFPAFAEPALEAVITHDGSKVIGGDWSGRTVMWNVADPKQATELSANPPGLQQQQQTLAARIAELDKAATIATTALANQQKAAEAAKASFDGLVAKLGQTKAALAKANGDKVAADKLLAQLKSQKATEDGKLKTVVARVVSLDKQIKDSTAQMQAASKQAADATARRDAASKEQQMVIASLTKNRTESNRLKAEATSKLSAITMRELEVNAKEQAAAAAEVKAEAGRKTAEQKVAEINGQITAASEKAKPLTEQLTSAKASQKKTADAIAALVPKVAEAQKAIDAKNAQIAGVKKQIAEAKEDSQKKALGENLTKLQGELTSAQGVKAAVDKQTADLKTQQMGDDKKVADLTAQIAAINKQKSNLAAQRDSTQKQLAEFAAQRDAATKEKSALGVQKNQIAAELATLTKLKQEAVDKIAVLVTQESDLMANENRLVDVVGREEDARAAATAKVTQLKAAIDQANPMLAAAKSEQQTISAKVTELAGKLKAQPAVIARVAAQIKQYTAAIPNIEKQIAAAKGKVDAAGKTVAEAKIAADAARANVDRAKGQLESIKTELVAFQAYAAQLDQQHAAAQTDAEAKRKAVQPEADKVSKITASMTARDQQLKQLTESLAKLQAQVAQMQKAQNAEKQTFEATQAKLKELEAAAETAEAEAESKKEKAEFFKSVYGA